MESLHASSSERVSDRVWTGVFSLIDEYAGALEGDFVLLPYTSDSAESAAWVSAALELRGIGYRRIWMAPLHDASFAQRLSQALPRKEDLLGRLIVMSFERDTMSHTPALTQALASYERERCATFRAISASPDLFSTALSVPPSALSARNTAILERCMAAKRLRISTAGGTQLEVGIDSKHRWISNRGVARPGGTVILPAGEVATFPGAIDGKFVADFAFNVNAITDRDARLQDHPVTVWVEGGRAVDFDCQDPGMRAFLEECFQTYCAYNVGELGFGTNPSVTDAIPMNSHINERRPGVHLGFGQHNQGPGIVDYQCSIHLDLIARGGVIWVDDDPVPLDLEHVVASRHKHPAGARAEDVFSPDTDELEVDDCCGILTADGLQLFSFS